MSPLYRSVVRALVTSALAAAASACASRSHPDRAPPRAVAPRPDTAASTLFDPSEAYRDAGLIVGRGTLPYVASVRFLRGRSPDTTLVFVALSFANRSLTFSGEGPVRDAAYDVALAFRRDGATAALVENHETVRVSSFRETARADESVVYQHFVPVSPGPYELEISVRDAGGAGAAVARVPIAVPALGAGALGSPVTAYEATPRRSADSLPRLIANPRATAVYGRDTTATIYLEGYGLGHEARVIASAVDEDGVVRVCDTLAPASADTIFSVVLTIPVARLGVGRHRIIVRVLGASDSVTTPLFVGFGEPIGIVPIADLVSYLRYYASPERLRALRDTSPERRARAWAAFWSDAESVAGPAPHQGLREYFARIEEANRRYRDDGQRGWLTDRGRVFITLGDPDQVIEQGNLGAGAEAHSRAQLWVYARYRAQLVFVDEAGFGHWRLTPGSEADFERLAALVRLP